VIGSLCTPLACAPRILRAALCAVGALLAIGAQAQDARFASVLVAPAEPTQFNGNVGFAVPKGWSFKFINGVVRIEPAYDPKLGPCFALLLPPMPAQRDLAAQAEALVNNLIASQFGGGRLRTDLNQDVKTNKWSRYDGVSATGWQFVELYGQVGATRFFIWAHVLLARMGDQVVPLIGVTKSTYQCLGAAGIDDANWMLLFHGLQLPGYTQPRDVYKKLLLGTWEKASSTIYVSETYAANGHFGRYGAHASYSVSTSGEIFQTTSGWPGDGTYEVHGDHITKTNSKGSYAGQPVTRLFSIVRRPDKDRREGFQWILRTLDKSAEGGQFLSTLGKVEP
jgi:hypothetical protein